MTDSSPPEGEVARRDTPPATRNVIVNWTAFAFAVGVNLFLTPFIVHSLGNTLYGIWVLLAQVVGYMGLLDLGVRSAVTRYAARYHALRHDTEASRVASAGLAMFLAFGVLAVVLALGLATVIDRIFTLPPDAVTLARAVLVLAGLNVGVALVSGVYGGVVSALQRFDLLAWSEMAIGALRAVAIVLAFRAGGGLIALAVIQLGCTVLRAAWQYRYAHRLYPQVRFLDRTWGRAELRTIFSFGAFASILHISGALLFSADAIVIGAFLPVGAVAFFAIGATLTDYARSVIRAISQNVTPRASALQARGEAAEVGRVVLRFARIASLVMFPMAVTFLIRGPHFIGIWMGESYAGPSGDVLRILALALLLAAARQVATTSLVGLNQHRRVVPFYAAEAVINVGLSVYWVKSLGISGVALATAIPNIATSVLVIPFLVRGGLAISLPRIWFGFWIRPALAMVPFAAATWLVEWWWPTGNLFVFFVQVALVLPLAGIGAWVVGLDRTERAGYAKQAGVMFRALPLRRKRGNRPT